MRISALPYCPDSAERFEAIADEPWSVFLDSGRPRSTMGRFDILAARPYVTLVTRGGMTEIRERDRPTLSPADPFELLRRYLAVDGHPTALPFAGGAIGYFACSFTSLADSASACSPGLCPVRPQILACDGARWAAFTWV